MVRTDRMSSYNNDNGNNINNNSNNSNNNYDNNCNNNLLKSIPYAIYCISKCNWCKQNSYQYENSIGKTKWGKLFDFIPVNRRQWDDQVSNIFNIVCSQVIHKMVGWYCKIKKKVARVL